MAVRLATPSRTRQVPADFEPTRDKRHRTGVRVLLAATLRDRIQEASRNDTARLQTRMDAIDYGAPGSRIAIGH